MPNSRAGHLIFSVSLIIQGARKAARENIPIPAAANTAALKGVVNIQIPEIREIRASQGRERNCQIRNKRAKRQLRGGDEGREKELNS